MQMVIYKRLILSSIRMKLSNNKRESRLDQHHIEGDLLEKHFRILKQEVNRKLLTLALELCLEAS